MNVLKTLLILLPVLFSCKAENKQELPKEEEADQIEQIEEKISFWDTHRKGANYFNQTPTREWFDAASKANIKFVRFVYEKWQGEGDYFLMGNGEKYEGIVEKDFAKLKEYLDYAHTLDIKVVLCPISIPGEKWIQSNEGKHDGRLWKSFEYTDQVVKFWKDLAIRLKDHPAIVGYNLVNEPHPEIHHKKFSFWNRDLADWYQSIRETPANLNVFNKKLVRSIREVDTETPIIVESGLYATPWAFDYLEPIDDDKIIYSFHMYEPYGFTTQKINDGQFAYGGKIAIAETGADFGLNRESLDQFFRPIKEWMEKYNIPANRMWVGEFGCNRHIEGVDQYLADLISIFNDNNWHWSFYAYREDVWEAMDYELGTQKVFYKYWEYQEDKELHLKYEEIYARVKDRSLWAVIEKEFK
ncbi:MAG: cellulase family glycosylhydrolase [Bacteroidota bacterium]